MVSIFFYRDLELEKTEAGNADRIDISEAKKCKQEFPKANLL